MLNIAFFLDFCCCFHVVIILVLPSKAMWIRFKIKKKKVTRTSIEYRSIQNNQNVVRKK